MALADDIAAAADPSSKLRRERDDARANLKVAEQNLDQLAREFKLLAGLTDGVPSGPPEWLTAVPKAATHHATPWLVLSDLHLDEVVQPAEVMGVNAYNRRIAELRLEATFVGAVKICRDYWSNIVYDGIVCPLLGDVYSGDIHDELSETNEDTILGSVLHWSERLAEGLSLLADEFGKVHVPVVVGNHGRRSRKPRAKFRARDNFDWFTGKLLERMFRDDDRVTFDVSESADVLVPSYGHRVMCTHGDQVHGGSGIGGIWPPLMRLDAKKRQRQAAVDQPYDLLVVGHWHQLVMGRDFIVNGSLKGADEYAFIGNFGYEDPAQALWLMTPERGKTFTAAVYPSDREAEGW